MPGSAAGQRHASRPAFAARYRWPRRPGQAVAPLPLAPIYGFNSIRHRLPAPAAAFGILIRRAATTFPGWPAVRFRSIPVRAGHKPPACAPFGPGNCCFRPLASPFGRFAHRRSSRPGPFIRAPEPGCCYSVGYIRAFAARYTLPPGQFAALALRAVDQSAAIPLSPPPGSPAVYCLPATTRAVYYAAFIAINLFARPI